jgi:hypothetical protein
MNLYLRARRISIGRDRTTHLCNHQLSSSNVQKNNSLFLLLLNYFIVSIYCSMDSYFSILTLILIYLIIFNQVYSKNQLFLENLFLKSQVSSFKKRYKKYHTSPYERRLRGYLPRYSLREEVSAEVATPLLLVDH